MGLEQKFSSAAVLMFNVVLVLLSSNSMLQAEGQYGPVGCLINCGMKLISCATGCGTDPLCLIGCGTTEIGCVTTCNGSSVQIPPVSSPGSRIVEVAGSEAAGTQTGTVKAVAVISSSSSSSDNNIRGFLQFLQDFSTRVTHVEGRIAGLTPGLHGLRIHAFGDNTNGCSSTGFHFHPLNKDPGALPDQNDGARDLGKIIAGPDGIAEVSIKGENIPLTGPQSTLGRTIAVDAPADDFGRRGNGFSKAAAYGGGRVGCGIVRLLPSVWEA